MLIALARNFLFTVLFLAGLTCGFIVFLPISVVANEIQKNIPDITIGQSSGQWWHGQLSHVSWQQLNNGLLSWELNLPALLEGNIEAKVSMSQKAVSASTTLTMPISQLLTPKKVEITGAQATIEIDQLTPYASYPLPNITGQVTVFVEHLLLDLNTLKSTQSNIPIIKLDSPITLSTSNIAILDNLFIGAYRGKITNTTNPLGYKLMLQSNSGELNVSGHSIVSGDHIISQYVVKPSPKIDPSLIQLLNIMGQKLQNGHYKFNTTYSL